MLLYLLQKSMLFLYRPTDRLKLERRCHDPEETIKTAARVWLLLGVLSVMGGHVDSVQPGSRVHVSRAGSGSAATVLSLDESSAVVCVLHPLTPCVRLLEATVQHIGKIGERLNVDDARLVARQVVERERVQVRAYV